MMYFFIAEKAKKLGIWQLTKEAKKAFSRFINSFLPRYSGAADSLTTIPPYN
ncbi:MAG: hypothetical protein ACI976_002209 [Aureispira sp.]|jgi:hypothetical protein